MLWQLVLDTFTLLPEPFTTQFKHLQLEIRYPADWLLEQVASTNGLNPLGHEPIATPFLIEFGSLSNLPLENLDTLTTALLDYYEKEDEPELSAEPFELEPYGEIGVRMTGFRGDCQRIFIPGADLVRMISISADACDTDGNLTNDAVALVLERLVLLDKE